MEFHIQTVLPRSAWKHVSSIDNPADLASRGCIASQLVLTELWWKGPNWLSGAETSWPNSFPEVTRDVPEQRTNAQILTTTTAIKENANFIDFKRYSNYNKLLHVTAHVIHFAKKLKKHVQTPKVDSPLHPVNIAKAKFLLLHHDQLQNLPKEYITLQSDRPLDRKSPLQNLAPFFDKEFNVIRVGGRLGQSPYCENKKFPVLISKNSSLVPLIIRHFHEASLHGGGQLTLNLIRQEFWIVNAKPLVNQFIKECITCFRFNTTPPVQLMADLPTERVTPSRPFTHCGIDFAGHFLVKNGETENKVYIAIFVCMSTKAVHMELVSSLSKDDCIMALNRFIARRGMPAKILSDNGTNFLGARNDLIKLNVLLDKTDRDNSLITFVNQRNCEWITIPPRAPHFGGIWEAAVKSMKRHLRRVVGKQTFSYEEFLTIINQVEAALNSRPISPLSNDPNDPLALTPGHFLIGDTLMSMPSGAPSKSNPVQRFRLVKKIQEDFWKSWKRDYLTELQIRKNGS